MTHELTTVEAGGSETAWARDPADSRAPQLYVLPSRRYFNPYFDRSVRNREQHVTQDTQVGERGGVVPGFQYRLFRAHERKEEFDRVMERVLSPLPDWTIDQSDAGQYFLKFLTDEGFHTSDGLGEGLVSLFFIVDALYDSPEADVIVIDEPELSLHPSLQRRLMALFMEYSATRQIICSTHSPYFVDFEAIRWGGGLVRVFQTDGHSDTASLSEETARRLSGMLNNRNNPHVLGIDAREGFFLDDGIVLLEGQEDVLHYDLAVSDVGAELLGEPYGWGVGGADNMALIATMLSELGFSRVVGIVDGDRPDAAVRLREQFPNYHFEVLSADDIRTKPERAARALVLGLLDEDHRVRPEHRAAFVRLLANVNAYFRGRHGA